jgi:hypothetical protein
MDRELIGDPSGIVAIAKQGSAAGVNIAVENHRHGLPGLG